MKRKTQKRQRRTGQQQIRQVQLPYEGNWTPGLLTGLGLSPFLWPMSSVGSAVVGLSMSKLSSTKSTKDFGSGLMWGSGIGVIAVPVAAYFFFWSVADMFKNLFGTVGSVKGPTTGMTDEEMYPWRWWGCGAGLGQPERAIKALEQCNYPWPCGCDSNNYFNQNSAW